MNKKFEAYSKHFKIEASKAGYTTQNIDHCICYAETLFDNNVPVIYNTSHLCALVGYNKVYLKRAVAFTKHFYRDFEILKKNGDKRQISEPLPSLKDIQLWILNNVLYKVKVSPFAKAYKPNTRLIDNLKFHQNQEKVFTLDIENFFSSIKQPQIEAIFLELGYSKILSNLISKLCCLDGVLPQGAPTSPCLSNIYFRSADVDISKYCSSKKIRYTRYADDMSFSGDFDEKDLLKFVTEIIAKIGLKLNQRKTKLMLPHTRQTVTGIVVNKKPQVDFEKRNSLRQTMYYIKKFGIDDHKKFRKISETNYLDHLLGRVNFVLQINPSDKEFIAYKEELYRLKTNHSTA